MALDGQMKAVLTPIYEASLVEPFYGFANPNNPMIRALQKQGLIVAYGSNQNPDDAKQYSFQCTEKGAAEFPTPMPAQPVVAPMPAPVPDIALGTPAQAETQSPGPGGVAPLATVLAGSAAAPAAGLTKSGKPRKARGPNKITEAPKIMVPSARIAVADLPPAEARVGGKRGPRTEKYPFGALLPPDETGLDSRFIAATAEMPNPAKMLASNVTKANKKYGPDRHFVIRYVAKDVEFGIAGARLLRDK